MLAVVNTTTRPRKKDPHIEPLRPGVRKGDTFHVTELIQYTDDGFDLGDTINHPDDDPLYGTDLISLVQDEWQQVAIHGSSDLQSKIRTILKEYKTVFRSNLPKQHAKVRPLDIDIDVGSWVQPTNQGPHRRQSINKDVEINRQIHTMLDNNVVRESQTANAWSQVLLTLKPNGKWRFCIDFRQLNKLIQDKGWPLPRINELLERVGQQQPKVFGKVDLTNGYHQMPLAESAKKWTAFKTSKGLYEWERVPMGLRNAAAYFQQAMATEVLNGLVHNTCELYLDDILIHATTEAEFLTRLKDILQRLKDRGIVLSPSKCSFGMDEVEILGHTMDDTGIHFSREKLTGVLDFKLPETGSNLHTFVGLCNYFRKHVGDIAKLESPLRGLIAMYPGTKKIKWETHPEAKAAFYALQTAVGKCPKLFFYNEHMPVFLHTDACNNGIGAYLFQVDEDGEEYPIGFMSQSLRGAELNWSTFEQECYAIVVALKKFQYLLRDIPFTIRTDHRNLLFLNQDASTKVLRWKWDIQQYNFHVEHIPGLENVVADIMSRLCSITTDTRIALSDISQDQVERIQGIPTLLASLSSTRIETPLPWQLRNKPDDPQIYKHIQAVHGWGGRCNDGNITNGKHGHGGIERTLRLLKDTLPPSEQWAGMRQSVQEFIHNCPQCQFMQTSKMALKAKAQTHPFNMGVRKPWERLNIDTIGPLPPDKDGNKYIMVIIDVFSRFIELHAVPDLSAAIAAPKIVETIGRYCCTPSQILTDNGTQYCNALAEYLYEIMMTDHLTIMAYSHEENSIVERANREVNKHLRAIVFDRKIKTNWSIALPLLQRLMNTLEHSATGCAPASIIMGNNVNLDQCLVYETTNNDGSNKTYPEYVYALLNMQAEIIARATTIQATVAQKHIQRKLKKGDNHDPYEIGQYVLWEHRESGLQLDSRPDKLSPHYRGPYRIVNINGSRITIHNTVTTKNQDVHITEIIPFRYNPNIVDPKTIALHAAQEFIVEDIISLEGTKNNKKRYNRTNLRVKVRWQGYNESEDSWEPYTELKGNVKFLKYCQRHGLLYLIDKRLFDDNELDN